MHFILLMIFPLLGAANLSSANHDVLIDQHPYQVAIEYIIEGRSPLFIVNGAIVSHNWVLTAGKWLFYFKNPLERLKVRAGSNLRGQGGSLHSVQEVELYGTFNDLALIRVAEPFRYGDTRMPIPVYEGSKPLFGKMAEMVWFGYEQPARLQSVEVPLVGPRKCCYDVLNYFRNYYIAQPQEVVWSPQRRTFFDRKGDDKEEEKKTTYKFIKPPGCHMQVGSACAGYYESELDQRAPYKFLGSSLVVDNKLVGLISNLQGYRGSRYDNSMKYVDVAHYKDWINEIAGVDQEVTRAAWYALASVVAAVVYLVMFYKYFLKKLLRGTERSERAD